VQCFYAWPTNYRTMDNDHSAICLMTKTFIILIIKLLNRADKLSAFAFSRLPSRFGIDMMYRQVQVFPMEIYFLDHSCLSNYLRKTCLVLCTYHESQIVARKKYCPDKFYAFCLFRRNQRFFALVIGKINQ